MRAAGTLSALSLLLVVAACDGGGGEAADSAPMDSGVATDAALDAMDDAGDAGMDAEPPFMVEGYCPGPGCDDEGDGVLHVGVATTDITPTITATTDIQTVDVNGNGEFDPFDGDEFEDRNDNGIYDGIWIAGFGNARAASGVNNPQTVRAIALRRGDTTLVLAVVDCIGYMIDEVELIRDAVGDLEIDYVSVSAIHVHEARDTLGIWGIDETVTGLDPDHMAFIRDRAAEAIRGAVADLRPANVQYATTRLRDQPGGASRYVSDTRDPKIIDDELRLMRFFDAGADTTIATLVNFASHPEYTGSENQELSSDFVHWLRLGVEDGVDGPDGPVAGVGGTAVFYQGALGSQVGPGRVQLTDWDDVDIERWTHLSAQTMGEQIAYFTLQALGPDGGSVTDETAALGYRNRQFMIDVQNRAFHVAFLGQLFNRQSYNWDPGRPLRPGVNEPDIITELAIVDIGRAQIMMIPGELDPGLFLGGYDGSYTPDDVDIVDLSAELPPDLSLAPEGPYLRDLAREDAEYVFLFGLANDMLGYLMPDFDFVLDRRSPYIDEAPGDHYEETNSIGVDGWRRVKTQMETLLAWTPEGGAT